MILLSIVGTTGQGIHSSKNIKHRIIEADGILRMQIVVSRAYRPAGLVTH